MLGHVLYMQELTFTFSVALAEGDPSLDPFFHPYRCPIRAELGNTTMTVMKLFLACSIQSFLLLFGEDAIVICVGVTFSDQSLSFDMVADAELSKIAKRRKVKGTY
jgi:hypothetical protein